MNLCQANPIQVRRLYFASNLKSWITQILFAEGEEHARNEQKRQSLVVPNFKEIPLASNARQAAYGYKAAVLPIYLADNAELQMN